MTSPIDYSRPVGWWCPVCGHDETETDVDVLWNLPDWLAGYDAHNRLVPIHLCTESGWCIPRYLPIPEGQRPPAASEVEEAEVVTLNDPTGGFCLAACDVFINERGWIEDGEPYTGIEYAGDQSDVEDINFIAVASEYARESARIVTGEDRMSTIEPTEEQKQAARQTKPCGTCRGDYGRMSPCVRCDDTGFVLDDEATMRIARLLAEREAKLREELSGLDALDSTMSDLVEVTAERDTLRERVAELEASDAHLRKLLAEERGNVGAHSAQHLADIRACVDVLHGLIIDTDKHGSAASAWKHAQLARSVLGRLAHYDANDAEGGEG